jgi:enediyne biosynthesis protein E4
MTQSLSSRGPWWLLGAVALLAAGAGVGAIYLAMNGWRQDSPGSPPALPGASRSATSIKIPHMPLVDVTEAAGIRFVHEPGTQGETLFPETAGGGLALFDYNTDGRLDLLFVNSTWWPDSPQANDRQGKSPPLSALYRNDGGFRFTDVTREAGLDFSFYGMGVAVGDYDNDNDPDLFLTAVGPCRLLRNDGGVFQDVTAAAGVAGDREGWTTSAGFFDYDLDGDLDLFVCTYVRWSRQANFDRSFRPQGGVRGTLAPQSFDGTLLKLYRNEGSGLFSDVSGEAGVEIVNPMAQAPEAKALGVAFADLNRDHWLDVLVANDSVRNFAFLNERDGRFSERGTELGVAYGPDGEARNGMGIDAADFRNDGTLGIAVGNFSAQMTALYVSTKITPPRFSDEAVSAGIGVDTLPVLTFGVVFFDCDLDGRLDLLQANGHVEPKIAQSVLGQTYEQPAQLFWNCGGVAEQDFVLATPKELGPDLGRPLVGRGAAYGDLDADGDLDVVLTGIGSLPRVLRNDQRLGHHWLRLKLVGRQANRDAIGALVEVTLGGVTQRQLVSPTKSYLTQCEPTLTFGLGTSPKVEAVRIVWPGGREQIVEDVQIDSLNVVAQKE